MRFANEDHFQNELFKRLSGKQWKVAREHPLSQLRMRADIVVMAHSTHQEEQCVAGVWIEAKIKLGMHELATALGQVVIARGMLNDASGGIRDKTGIQFVAQPMIVVPESLYEESVHAGPILDKHNIAFAHENNVVEMVESELNHMIEAHRATRDAIYTAVSKVK